MAANSQNVKTYAGDDAILAVAVTDENGAALDLTGSSFVYVAATYEGGAAVITKTSAASQITVTNASAGLLSVNIGHTDTIGLLGAYWHQIVMSDGTGTISTITTGTITFAGRT